MNNFKKRLVSLTSAATLVMTGFNMPALQMSTYAEETNETVVSQKAKGWTLGLYLCGQNLESWNGCATSDVMEILKADVPKGFSKDNNIIIETGGCTDWHFKEIYSDYLKEEKGLSDDEIEQVIPEEIDSSKLSQYKVNFEHEYTTDDGEVKTIPTLEFVKDVADYDPEIVKEFSFDYDEDEEETTDDMTDDITDDTTEVADDTSDENIKYANMGDEYFLKEFLNDLDTNFPAEHMALDLWNHGGGITGGVCYDQYIDDPITLGELKNALKDRVTNGFDKIDIVGYDACLMSNYETWVNLSSYAKVGVGSLTSEPGDGWYYTPFIEELGANYADEKFTPAKFASSIVDAYGSYYKYDGVLMQDAWAEELESDAEYAKRILGKEPELVGDGDETSYSDDFEKMAEDALGDAMLCAVDLENIALTAPEFAAIGEDLFKAYADNEGVKSIFKTATEKGCVDEGSEIVELSKLTDAIGEIAPQRIEALKDSTNPYHKIASTSYQNLVDGIGKFGETVSGSLINAYNGWDSCMFNDSFGMSLFVPDENASEKVAMFNADEYIKYSIGDAYARLAYLYGSGIDFKEYSNIEFNTQYKYDASTGKFSVTIDQDSVFYADFINAFYFVNKNNVNYYTGETNIEPWWDETNVLEVKPNDEYYTLGNDSRPIVTNKYDYSGESEPEDGEEAKQIEYHTMECFGYLNGQYGTFHFTKDLMSGGYAFDCFEYFDESSNDESDDMNGEETMNAHKKLHSKAKKHIKDKTFRKNDEGEYDEWDEYEDYYFDDNVKYIEDLNKGDVIKFEIGKAEKPVFMPDSYGKFLQYEYTDDYVIGDEDYKKVRVIGYDITDNVILETKKIYTPTINLNKAEAKEVNVALGVYTTIGYDDETNESTYREESRIFNYGKVKAFAEGNITLEQKEYELTGEAITPKPIFEGADLVEGTDYTVTYENNIGLGKAKAVIKGLGDLDIVDDREIEFEIVKVKPVEGKEKTVYVTVIVKAPKQVKIKSVKRNKKAFTVKWKKVKKAAGYEVKYALNKKFTKGKKVKTIKNPKKLSLKVKKLKKKTYFVKVRAFVVDKNGDKVYGDWSKAKKVKVK